MSSSHAFAHVQLDGWVSSFLGCCTYGASLRNGLFDLLLNLVGRQTGKKKQLNVWKRCQMYVFAG